MRVYILSAAVSALATFGASAESLSSCRSITDNGARLNCYDRMASVGGPTLTPVSAPVAAASDQFSGFYAGVSGHFGGADLSTLHSNAWSGTEDNFRINSPSVGAFAGFNQRFGGLVVGGEMSLRGDIQGQEAYRWSYSNATSLPRDSYSGWSSMSDPLRGTGTRLENAGPLTLATNYESTTSIREAAGSMISSRLGASWGDFLFYGRGGIGVSIMQNKVSTVETTRTCAATVMQIDYTPNSERATYIGCVDPTTTTDRTQTTKTRLAPTFAAAIGAEYHHDRYFGRIEAEARYIHWGNRFLPSGDSGTMRYQVGIGAGIKF